MSEVALFPPAPPEPFAIGGELPDGFTVLEASAGTGKTYSLAGLVTRFVAERGVLASQVCVVSFTEAATAELRGRIRTRLAEAAAHLAADGAGPEPTGEPDLVLAALAADPAERWVRRQRLEAALADFDAASISTIHGFCSRVVSTGTGVELPLTADDSDVDELVADAVLARYGASGRWPAEPAKVADAVRLRLQLPDASMRTLDPTVVATMKGDQAQRAADLVEIAELVEQVVADVQARRQRERRRTFDGLITGARDLLAGPQGPAVRTALQSRFRLVMIDEFQDTDQVQWDIFRSAFLDGAEPATVVVVGDPKQSIYRFRSAELSAYLDARARADRVTSLDTNRRSDGPVLAGLGRVFANTAFGDPHVRFHPVRTAPGHEATRLVDAHGAPYGAALSLRELATDTAGEVRARALRDLVGEVVRLLDGAHVLDADGRPTPLQASDIGVLVRSNADATRYVAALAEAGVPAASSSNDSVLDSPAATQWRILLAALERPSSAPRARAAALGWFVGQRALELEAAGDEGLGALAELLRGWAGVLVEGGLARLMAEVRAHGLLERVLSRPGGERDLTDLDHVQELLQSVVGGRPVGASALLGVLDDLTVPGRVDDEALAPELLARRIDRDDDTVKVLTVHRAKGLEFPVVLCPTLWTKRPNRMGLPHAHTAGGRVIDTNALRLPNPLKGGKRFEEVCELDAEERRGEDARLLYVALTRARHRLVVWWSPPEKGEPPLAELLTQAGGGRLDLPALVAASGGAIEVVDVGEPASAPRSTRPVEAPTPLEVARARRALDDRWRIWSFSSVKAAADARAEAEAGAGAPVGDALAAAVVDAPAMGGVDEPATEAGADVGVAPPLVGAPTPLQGAPAGTAFGTLVHGVLERVDFAGPDLAERLALECDEQLAHRRLDISGAELAAGLVPALMTPLGGPMGERALVHLTRADRLDELSFDLPLARFGAAALAATVLGHLPDDDRLRGWFAAAADGGLEVDVDGMLTGSIDLVGRTDGRYWLADYKTNLLRDGDYRPEALAEAMGHHGYPLQATLYLVALHRYLRWRLPAYDPDEHLAGAAYLFLRGMRPEARAAGEPAAGVLWWRPPTAAIVELDELLATGAAA